MRWGNAGVLREKGAAGDSLPEVRPVREPGKNGGGLIFPFFLPPLDRNQVGFFLHFFRNIACITIILRLYYTLLTGKGQRVLKQPKPEGGDASEAREERALVGVVSDRSERMPDRNHDKKRARGNGNKL